MSAFDGGGLLAGVHDISGRGVAGGAANSDDRCLRPNSTEVGARLSTAE